MQTAANALVVLQVLPALETGGVERGTVEMAAAITGAGGRALVASAGGRMVAEVERTGARHVTLSLRSKNPLTVWRNAARLATLIRAEGVRIVHARSRAPAWSAWLAARRTGAHFLTTWHGVYGEDLPLKRHYNAIMARGERVIAISRYVARQVVERHGVDPARLRVIPRGVDPLIFDPARVTPERVTQLARGWGLAPERKVVMLPGRLTEWKGQGVMIEALARLGGEACLVLVGPEKGGGAYARRLRRQAAALDVGDRVVFAGRCDDMPAALALADVVVVPSVKPEPFGRVVVEAQAMGKPVIVTDQGGAAETVAAGETGWRVPPADPAALAEAVAAALALDEAGRSALGAAARGAVLARYTTQAMQQATLAVYRELLA